MNAIPLEDNFDDILAKAARGLKIAREDLARQTGLDLATVKRLFDGEYDEAAVRRLAPVLQLGPETLTAIATHAYRPDVTSPEGLLSFNTPFDDYHVNAYMVFDPLSRRAVAFDTGSDGQALLDAAKAHGLTIELILLTHTHLDHIMCLDALVRQTGAPAYVSTDEPTAGAEGLTPGRTFTVGALHIEARRTAGHSKGGTSYVVRGLGAPLVAVGDALFAGSMGGGMVSWQDALANNRREIFSLSDDTVILPGHGPLTTVGLEKRHNPCYPEFN